MILNRLDGVNLFRATDGFWCDGGCLFFKVREKHKSWVFRYKKNKKQISVTIGNFDDFSLEEARYISSLMRTQVTLGLMPHDARRHSEALLILNNICKLASDGINRGLISKRDIFEILEKQNEINK